MKSIVFFNNKGGVGKTSLVYHLGFALAELGKRVVLADFDPQANLSSMCLTEERVENLWAMNPRPTIYSAIAPLKSGIGDISLLGAEAISDKVALILGDLRLSEFEDDLSQQWPKCLERDERAFRVTTALARVARAAAIRHSADVLLLDVGPNFGAINRAALICSDFAVMPVAPDLFSMQGLENVGPKLREWREGWKDRRDRAPKWDFELPEGNMEPVGYVISRHSVLSGGAVKAFQRWIDRMPATYRESFGIEARPNLAVTEDEFCLARLKDFRSLMPMAQEAKKPMFFLKPADGAIGGHQGAVRDAYADFAALAKKLIDRTSKEEKSRK